jgi:predicted nuclease of restriction endonuclease-like RecB superfamily
MLTAELVRARRKNGELVIRPLGANERARALELATAYVALAREAVGRTRSELLESWAAVPVAPREKRLADGLKKLVEDAADFGAVAPVDPVELRSEVFLEASRERAGLEDGARFDRGALVERVAALRSLSPSELERSLYADLKGEQILLAPPPVRPDALVHDYDRGQAQAVLLRAVRVVADVDCRTPEASRALFRELKFRRLLHRIERRPDGGYRVEIDGPFSLFESVTKYGLELALVLPALERAGSLRLVADVRWGKERAPLVFRHEHVAPAEKAPPGSATAALRDDVRELVAAFEALGSAWRVREARDVFDLPGIGVCVPDLVFERKGTGERVFFEALGFWSRDAVWKRVELVRSGLARPIVFAVSSRLRVSEAVLDDAEAAALYVYKGVMSARAVERKLEDSRTRKLK